MPKVIDFGVAKALNQKLTDTTPFEQRRLHNAAYHEACRIIRDEDPPRPSIRLSTHGETATVVSTTGGQT